MPARSTPAKRADFPAHHRLQTRWMDADVYGHINNAVHYALFDTAVNEALIERGLLDPAESAEVALVVESGCSYFSELNFPGHVTAGLRVAHLGCSSVRYELGLFGAGNDTAAAQGFFTHVYIDRLTRRPIPIPEQTRTFLEQLLKTGIAASA